MGGAQVTANTRTEMEEDKIKEEDMLLTGVIVLIMAPFVVRYFQ